MIFDVNFCTFYVYACPYLFILGFYHCASFLRQIDEAYKKSNNVDVAN